MNFEEQLKQIDICAVGPLRVSQTLFKAGLIKGSVVIITSQAGSAEWRFTQNPEGGGARERPCPAVPTPVLPPAHVPSLHRDPSH